MANAAGATSPAEEGSYYDQATREAWTPYSPRTPRSRNAGNEESPTRNSGNEADASWSEKIAKSRKPWAKEVKENLTEIVRLQNKLSKLEKIIQLPISEIKDINR